MPRPNVFGAFVWYNQDLISETLGYQDPSKPNLSPAQSLRTYLRENPGNPSDPILYRVKSELSGSNNPDCLGSPTQCISSEPIKTGDRITAVLDRKEFAKQGAYFLVQTATGRTAWVQARILTSALEPGVPALCQMTPLSACASYRAAMFKKYKNDGRGFWVPITGNPGADWRYPKSGTPTTGGPDWKKISATDAELALTTLTSFRREVLKHLISELGQPQQFLPLGFEHSPGSAHSKTAYSPVVGLVQSFNTMIRVESVVAGKTALPLSIEVETWLSTNQISSVNPEFLPAAIHPILVSPPRCRALRY